MKHFTNNMFSMRVMFLVTITYLIAGFAFSSCGGSQSPQPEANQNHPASESEALSEQVPISGPTVETASPPPLKPATPTTSDIPVSTADASQGTPCDAMVQGSLSKEVICQVAYRRIDEVKSCYKRELSTRPDMAGRVSIKFIIAGSGAVQMAAVAESTISAPKVESCIAQAVRQWTFPQPEGGGIVIVTYPFLLEASGVVAAEGPTAAQVSSTTVVLKALPNTPSGLPCEDGDVCVVFAARLDEDDLEDAIVSEFSQGATSSAESLSFWRRLPGKKGWAPMKMGTETVIEGEGGDFFNRVTIYRTGNSRPIVCVPGETSKKSIIYDGRKESCFYWLDDAWIARNREDCEECRNAPLSSHP